MAAISPIEGPEQEPGHALMLMRLLKVLLVIIVVLTCAYLLVTHLEWFDNPDLLKVEILKWGLWGPLIYILLFAIGPSFLIPGVVMSIAGGLAFGALWGAAYAFVGADLGALIAFGMGRFLGQSFVRQVVGVSFERALDHIERHGFQIVFYLRLVPVVPYNALNLLAGASPISFRDYFWASVIGMVPGTILFAFLGDALWHPTSPRFFMALGLIALCVGCSELARRWRMLPGS